MCLFMVKIKEIEKKIKRKEILNQEKLIKEKEKC